MIDKQLLNDISGLIEQAKRNVSYQINSTVSVLFWQVGNRIKKNILKNKRANYGEEIVVTLSRELTIRYGRNFEERNLRRMIQFAEPFSDFEIVATLSPQLSWSHFITLFPLKDYDTILFYAKKITEERWSIRHTRKQIQNKVFERTLLAKSQVPQIKDATEIVFKDPYFLDFLGLKEGYLENDLETAILKELELFILELGNGFTFVERQKRLIIDGDDFYLDLLFYHRKLKRLVAIELKLGKFKAAYKGQMELYLHWLDRYEKQPDENNPIGLILCAETSREQVELVDMYKDGIMVAEYWTELPPKEMLEAKLRESLIHAKNRLERKRLKE